MIYSSVLKQAYRQIEAYVAALSPADRDDMIQVGGPVQLKGMDINEYLDKQMPFPF
jgi:hypothetical protein